MRDGADGPGDARFTGHVAYRGLIPAERVAHLPVERTSTVRMGPGAHFVHYFIAAGRLFNAVQEISRGNAERFHLPDDPAQMARDAAMASSYGLSPDIDWLYGYDPLTGDRAAADTGR